MQFSVYPGDKNCHMFYLIVKVFLKFGRLTLQIQVVQKQDELHQQPAANQDYRRK